MAIEISSNEWQTAEKESNLRRDLLDYLREHPKQAFHKYDLADELTGTDWDTELSQTESEQAIEEQYSEDDNRFESIEEIGILIMYRLKMSRVHVHLQALQDSGLIEARAIPLDQVDLSLEGDVITYYSVSNAD